MSDGEVLIRAQHVSKKFCRSLKRSLWYGAQDVANSLMPWKRDPCSTGANDDLVFREPELRKDEFWAVRDVSFEVRRGECLGLIGHNGAGKSTLLKILNSLIRPDAGRITMKGRVGALIELSAGFNPILTGRENIYNQAALLGFSSSETDAKFDAIVDFSELGDFLDMPVQNYSSGMRVRLGFAIAAQMEPDILLLDEVLAVGDLGFSLKCLNRIGELMPHTTTIFVSHNMQQVARICTGAILLESGNGVLNTADVAEGIQAYARRFSGLKSKELGNGSVRLGTVQIAQWDGSLSRAVTALCAFQNGATLILDLGLEVISEPAERTFAIVKIYDQQLRECVNSFSHEATGQTYALRCGALQLRVELPALHLNRGLHHVSVSVEGAQTRQIYCHATNVAQFMVQSKIQGWATSTVPGLWRELSSD